MAAALLRHLACVCGGCTFVIPKNRSSPLKSAIGARHSGWSLRSRPLALLLAYTPAWQGSGMGSVASRCSNGKDRLAHNCQQERHPTKKPHEAGPHRVARSAVGL